MLLVQHTWSSASSFLIGSIVDGVITAADISTNKIVGGYHDRTKLRGGGGEQHAKLNVLFDPY